MSDLQDVKPYDKTWGSLIEHYKTDPDSPYHKKRYATRQHYDTLCRRLNADCGVDQIATTDARKLLRLHEGWTRPNEEGGQHKVSMGHALVGMMRTIGTFGSTLLKCPDCKAVRSDLHDMRVTAGKPREVTLTSEQAIAVRNAARANGVASVALSQAISFDFTWRQRDSLGEWVPIEEKNVPLSDVIDGGRKWIRGLRYEEFDQNLIVRHVTSKRNKLFVGDLRHAPMICEELRLMFGVRPDEALTRAHLPASGPVVVCEHTGLPWSGGFAGRWRKLAQSCGIPDSVRNMDSRAGAITEAFAAGADPDAIRKGATHSNISMTTRYSRGDEQAVAGVMQKRVEFRNTREG